LAKEIAMFGLGVPELIVILVIALVLFGPGRLPEVGGALGRAIRDFRNALSGKDEDGNHELENKTDDGSER
jgi:sec-independent protein translocase protein TatA